MAGTSVMIDEIRIENLGVLDAATLDLGEGLTAITGETGAGKTMLLDSLRLLLGNKADAAKVRRGAAHAHIEGTMTTTSEDPVIAILEDAGARVDVDDALATIILSRTVPAQGRSRAYAGGRSVPQSLLSEVAEQLVTVHGQSDQRRLTSPVAQLAAVDAMGGEPVVAARNTFASARQAWLAAKAAVAEFDARQANVAQERLALTALLKAVEAADPRVGEEEELLVEAKRLDNVEALRSALAVASNALESDHGSAVPYLDEARRSLESVGDDQPIAHLAERTHAVIVEATDISREIGQALTSLEADPRRLDDIHARVAELRSLERTLGMTVAQAVTAADEARTRLGEFADPEAARRQLTEAATKSADAMMAAGEELSTLRRRAATSLEEGARSELTGLAMKSVSLTVSVKRAAEPRGDGLDEVEFLLNVPSSAEPVPLASSASGGELSRIMLALELTIASHGDRPPGTFIFDEIDAGIGGRAALAVGQRLAELAAHTQVVVVTHLAQVAAYATRHIVVDRPDGASATTVTSVDGEERRVELARMLSGSSSTEALRHADELLEQANVGR